MAAGWDKDLWSRKPFAFPTLGMWLLTYFFFEQPLRHQLLELSVLNAAVFSVHTYARKLIMSSELKGGQSSRETEHFGCIRSTTIFLSCHYFISRTQNLCIIYQISACQVWPQMPDILFVLCFSSKFQSGHTGHKVQTRRSAGECINMEVAGVRINLGKSNTHLASELLCRSLIIIFVCS